MRTMKTALSLMGILTLLGGCFDGGSKVAPDSGVDVADSGTVDTSVAADAEQDITEDVGDDTGGDAAMCGEDLTACGDECVNLTSDNAHCGGCNTTCEPGGEHRTATCIDSVCDRNCEAGWVDSNGDPSDGCELECVESNGGVEICDGQDNDCNGITDDGYSTGACTVGIGACESSGQFVCVDDQTAECDAPVIDPGQETCGNGVDDDCDGETDEADAVDATEWFADADGDGYGDSSDKVTACEQPQGYVDNDLDCDDTRDTTNPDGQEACDTRDNDCDGDTDEEASDATTWYGDSDGDGYGDSSDTTAACEQPQGYVDNDTDCAPMDSTRHTDVTVYVDADQDTYTTGGATSVCSDGTAPSGYQSAQTSEDCNDSDQAINPGATEMCDTVDNDCDGTVDEDDAADAPTWYKDDDGDGYGDPNLSRQACERPARYVANNTDCDPSNGGEWEWIDVYSDQDQDGFTKGAQYRVCSNGTPPPGTLVQASAEEDCDDTRVDDYPGADEYCDNRDNDCDGQVDESSAVDAKTWWLDCDEDGFTTHAHLISCNMPGDYCPNMGGTWRLSESSTRDCQDKNADVFPGQTAYFASPYDPGDGSTSYDYNCDEDEEGVSAVNATCDSSCNGYSGWVGSNEPACGNSAQFQRCGRDPFTHACIDDVRTEVQTCR